MRHVYLEVTFRKGKPVAAYLYLPRAPETRVVRSVEVRPTVLVDYSATGEAVGLELTAPSAIDHGTVNDVLTSLGLPPVDPAELAPLRAA